MRSRSLTTAIGSLATAGLTGALVACSGARGEPVGGPAPDATAAGASAPDASSSPSCTIEAPTSCPSPAPTYANVAPLIESRCASCHSGAADGPWPLRDYQLVDDWADSIRDDLLACSMPPPDAGAPMPDAEKLVILTWIRCGAPR